MYTDWIILWLADMKNKSSDNKFTIASMLATYCNIGNVKYAPGTFGSLATFPLFLLLNYIFSRIGISTLCQLTVAYVVTLSILFYAAFWSIGIYIGVNKKEDPSEVVIDEVIGQMIAYMMPTLLTLYYFMYIVNNIIFDDMMSFLISFILILAPIMFFRIFDILKPGLVGYFDEKVKGAAGIIMDDVVAGVYAGFVVCLILTLLFASVGYFY